MEKLMKRKVVIGDNDPFSRRDATEKLRKGAKAKVVIGHMNGGPAVRTVMVG